MSDETGRARVQLLKMELLVSDLRVRYWMTAAIGVVVGLACLGGMAWACLAAAGRIVPGRPQEPVEILALSAAAIALAAWTCSSVMLRTAVLVAGVRQQIGQLSEALALAEGAMRDATGGQGRAPRGETPA